MDTDCGPDCRIAETIALVSFRIRALRRERGLTVRELAERCEMERPNLSRIESGRTNPTLRTLCVICQALNAEPADLLAGECDAAEQVREQGENPNN